MTYSVANVAITNTFDYWRNQSNYLAYASSNLNVTVNSGTAVGNAAISGAFAYSTGQIWQSNTTTSGNSTQTIDTFELGLYRTAEYIISVNDNNSNSHYASKILITHDNGTAYITEYAVMQSNNSAAIGPFTASIASGNVYFSFTPVSTNTTINFNRTLVTV